MNSHPRRGRAFLRVLVPTLALALLAAACGGDDGSATDGSDTGTAAPATSPSPTADPATATDEPVFPVSVSADNGEVTIVEQPERIVSLSPSATEMLFAIGAGDLVVAADQYSDYPEQAPTSELSGFTPNVEAILEYDPDLVVASTGPEDLVEGLAAADVPVVVQDAPADLDGTYAQIEALGAATGNVGGAAALVAQMQSDIEEILAGIETPAEPITYYHELDPSHFTLTSATFIGEAYALLGMESIADASAESGDTYSQLNEEFILEADPDVILLADTTCCGVTAEQIAERPGWDTITAVERGAVIELDDDVASRWGPRIVELLRTVAEHLAALEPAA